MEYMIWVWLAIFIILILVEVFTVELISIWFAGGALVALVVSYFAPDQIALQITVAVIVACVLLFVTRPLIMRYFKRNEIKTNVDSIIGKVGVVTQKIDELTVGEVKVEGKLWSAIAREVIEPNNHVIVLAVEGVKLIVQKTDL